MSAIKTPGVYIVEKDAFPDSVVEVATAVPAFIGYTATSVNGGRSLKAKPWRITSMADYLSCFGGPPSARFSLSAAPLSAGADAKQAPQPTDARAQVGKLSWKELEYTLARSAGKAGGRFLMYQAMQHFFLNGGGPCYVVSVGSYEDEISAGDETQGLISGLTALLEEQEPTLVLVPDCVLLDAPACIQVQQQVLLHCGYKTHKRFAILDVWGGDRARQDAEFGWDCVDHFRANLGTNFLDFAAAYYPWLNTSLVPVEKLDLTAFADATPDLLARLKTDSDLCAALLKLACQQINLMPPSAAMAGIYTMVDNLRGVWKAPANLSLAAVVSPAVDISAEEQEDLNVCLNGKSVNAIRSFVGEGVLVWGARTLDGNSQDWRYINVRRTVIMIEQSCMQTAKSFVFQPNAAETWAAIKARFSDYLTGLWKRGGLAGAAPADAFSVQCGLGETMTPEDILEGVLRVTVLVALMHPAEFIEITFQQQMQKS